ncbi:MAG: DEAD/DEAH box helicase [Selenomonadaceae bacterium]|nr:DEAD/DEAH box helicase [Selenomonadaceae bacterium]
MAKFRDLHLNPALCESLKRQGIEEATAVQLKTIPIVRQGQDVIVTAQTGTGKTLAFLLPILEKIKRGAAATQGLIITPTRELALQITKVAASTQEATGVTVLTICGGQDIERQKERLRRKPQLIIGTPGRLLDHLRRHTIDLSRVNKVVLDEADEMMRMGFIEDVETLLKATAPDRQLMLFSATMPPVVRGLAKRYMKEPQEIKVTATGGKITLETIEQLIVDTTEETKLDKLCHIINTQRPYLAMIFCHTKERVTKLTLALARRGYLAEELQGDLTQTQRNAALKKFREAKIQFLVATDVAARGLDIPGVTHVYNYDIPQDAEWYIHRIGRTGRAGQHGVAVTLVNAGQYPLLRRIEAAIKERLPKDFAKERPHAKVEAKTKARETNTPEKATATHKPPKPKRFKLKRRIASTAGKKTRRKSPTKRRSHLKAV